MICTFLVKLGIFEPMLALIHTQEEDRKIYLLASMIAVRTSPISSNPYMCCALCNPIYHAFLCWIMNVKSKDTTHYSHGSKC